MSKLLILTPPPTHPDGVTVGETTADKAGFHGTAVIQRASANGAAVSTVAIAAAAGANPTKAEYDALVVRFNAALLLIDELRTACVAKGIHKGAA